jgi:hypothetical protein
VQTLKGKKVIDRTNTEGSAKYFQNGVRIGEVVGALGYF